LSAYSAVNQGHCHPNIVAAMITQLNRCTLSSRAFHNDVFPRFAQYVTSFFHYDMVLPMNTGAEGVETALKLARKWGYLKKGIPDGEAIIISCNDCFHGRTLAIISMSTDSDARKGFGPFISGMAKVPFNDINALKETLQKHGDKVCAFLVEPVQGEAGVIIPDDGYIKECYDLCKKYNVLFIADEVQTGLGRTGKLLCCDWSGVRPDVVILGKAISGGMMPISCVLADKDIMLCIKPGEHGSTYGGNPLASAVGIASLRVIEQEGLVKNSEKLGVKLLAKLKKIKEKTPAIVDVRGKGLFCAIEMNPKYEKSAWDVCILLKGRGLLCKPTHDHIIRLSPPLIITEVQLDQCLEIIEGVFNDLDTIKKEDIPKQ